MENNFDILKHLTFWYNKSDDECVDLATNEDGIDAGQALLNMAERDACTDISNSIVEELKQL